MINRILESDFFWGFNDIRFHFREWWRLVTLGSNSPNCLQTKQWEHEFFNGMTSAVSRYCDYWIEYQKYV